MRNKWSKQKIIETIRLLHQQGKPLNSHYAQTHYRALRVSACKPQYFGSWRAAIEAAGIPYMHVNTHRTPRFWTAEKIILAIQRRQKCGLPINALAVAKQDHGLYRAAFINFGKDGWDKALRGAGFDPHEYYPHTIWSEKIIQRTIKRLKRLDVPLNPAFLQKSGYLRLMAAGRVYYGSWKKAVESAGLNYRSVISRNQWDKQKIVDEIQRLEKQGVRLNTRFMEREHRSLYAAARLRFGGWYEALTACGIDYKKHWKMWSYRTWLKTLKPNEIEKMKQ